MDINNPFYLQIIETLNKGNVLYVLIGGLAVAYHGYTRYTGDMDLWIRPEKQNMDRLYVTLIKHGYSKETIDEIKISREISNPVPIKLKDDNERLRVDLMTNTYQKEISWEECYKNATIMYLDQIEVPVVHINHLIQMKEHAKRIDNSLKDLVDAEELKKIRDIREKGGKK